MVYRLFWAYPQFCLWVSWVFNHTFFTKHHPIGLWCCCFSVWWNICSVRTAKSPALLILIEGLGNGDATMGWGCRKSFSREKRQDLVFCGVWLILIRHANGQKPETHLSAAGAISTESWASPPLPGPDPASSTCWNFPPYFDPGFLN